MIRKPRTGEKYIFSNKKYGHHRSGEIVTVIRVAVFLFKLPIDGGCGAAFLAGVKHVFHEPHVCDMGIQPHNRFAALWFLS